MESKDGIWIFFSGVLFFVRKLWSANVIIRYFVPLTVNVHSQVNGQDKEVYCRFVFTLTSSSPFFLGLSLLWMTQFHWSSFLWSAPLKWVRLHCSPPPVFAHIFACRWEELELKRSCSAVCYVASYRPSFPPSFGWFKMTRLFSSAAQLGFCGLHVQLGCYIIDRR